MIGKVRHLAAARWFESLGEEELAGALAAHYLAAYRSAPDGVEADVLAAQARIALKAAAERAASLGSHEQALAFLDGALSVTSDPLEQAELLERGGEAASAAGRNEAAAEHLHRAVDLQRANGQRSATARATAALATALLYGRQTVAARDLLEPAVEEFSDLGDDTAFAALLGQLARAYFLDDDPRAVTMADRALEVAERLDLVAVIADTLVTRGGALGNAGRSYEGIGAIRAGVELAEARGLMGTVLRGQLNLAGYLAQRDPRAALDAELAAIALARRQGRRQQEVTLLTGAIEDAVRAGDWDFSSREHAEEAAVGLDAATRGQLSGALLAIRAFRGEEVAAAVLDATPPASADTDRMVSQNWHDLLAGLALAAGRLREAFDESMAVAAFSAMNAPFSLPRAARAALWDHDAASARTAYEAFVATAAHGPAMDASDVTIRAGVTALEGRTGEAGTLYREALMAWQELRLPWDEALCAIDMATLLGPDRSGGARQRRWRTRDTAAARRATLPRAARIGPGARRRRPRGGQAGVALRPCRGSPWRDSPADIDWVGQRVVKARVGWRCGGHRRPPVLDQSGAPSVCSGTTPYGLRAGRP